MSRRASTLLLPCVQTDPGTRPRGDSRMQGPFEKAPSATRSQRSRVESSAQRAAAPPHAVRKNSRSTSRTTACSFVWSSCLHLLSTCAETRAAGASVRVWGWRPRALPKKSYIICKCYADSVFDQIYLQKAYLPGHRIVHDLDVGELLLAVPGSSCEMYSESRKRSQRSPSICEYSLLPTPSAIGDAHSHRNQPL